MRKVWTKIKTIFLSPIVIVLFMFAGLLEGVIFGVSFMKELKEAG